jgi:hypothetical protein
MSLYMPGKFILIQAARHLREERSLREFTSRDQGSHLAGMLNDPLCMDTHLRLLAELGTFAPLTWV